jgi:EpsI family protein
MTHLRRTALAASILSVGLIAQRALEAASGSVRPELKGGLSSLPLRIGDWVGRDEMVEPAILRESQADDYLNRVYENARQPGRRLVLWVNYSRTGLNLRHSPEICLPGGGFTKVESQSRTLQIPKDGQSLPLTRLVYSKGELVQTVGFWYYIFGEGSAERFVRSLPISSRGSHGRTTRGSGLTVEVFCPGEADPDGFALIDFGRSLLPHLESLLPEDRANYHIP